MATSKPSPPATQASNDVLAKMMQAEVNEGGPPPATPCDTPVEVISRIHMKAPEQSVSGAEGTPQTCRKEFEKTATENLDRLRSEIRELQTRSVAIREATIAAWSATLADLEAKQKLAQEKLVELTKSTGEAWGQLRGGVKYAWEELERAIRIARSKF